MTLMLPTMALLGALALLALLGMAVAVVAPEAVALNLVIGGVGAVLVVKRCGR